MSRHPAPTFVIENKLRIRRCGAIAGIDEAGRGAWAGPVVAAAVILNPHCTPAGLKDSKLLSERRREALYKSLLSVARIGVGEATVSEIDAMGVGKATYLAMERAAAALPLRPTSAIVDGLYAPKIPGCLMVTAVKGDRISLSVAAASIVAKVTRDREMRRLDKLCPAYGWASNKGYGAKAHGAALETDGVTTHHRASFAPIKNYIASADDAPLAERFS